MKGRQPEHLHVAWLCRFPSSQIITVAQDWRCQLDCNRKYLAIAACAQSLLCLQGKLDEDYIKKVQARTAATAKQKTMKFLEDKDVRGMRHQAPVDVGSRHRREVSLALSLSSCLPLVVMVTINLLPDTLEASS